MLCTTLYYQIGGVIFVIQGSFKEYQWVKVRIENLHALLDFRMM